MTIVLIYLGSKGAGPAYSWQMANQLCKNGCRIKCIVPCQVENLGKWKNLDRCYDNFSLELVYTYNTKLEFLYSLFNWKLFRQLVKVVTECKPDILYVPFPFLWEYFIIPFVSNKIVKVRTLHDVIAHSGRYRFFFQLKSNLAYHFYNKFVVLSQCFIPLVLCKGISQKDIVHIPHANFSYYTNEKKCRIVNNSPSKVIGFFGTISPYKGIDILLLSFQKIIEKHPDYKLLIAGRGEFKPYLPLISRMKDNIILYNRWIEEDEVASLIQSVDFLVLPYKDASQSGVIPLANSFAKPVIATNVGALQEQVMEDTGILVEPNNINEIVSAMELLISDYSLLCEKGNNAERLSKELSWEKSSELLLNAFRLWLH